MKPELVRTERNCEVCTAILYQATIFSESGNTITPQLCLYCPKCDKVYNDKGEIVQITKWD